ncbi:MAG: T9SS type A sorting domain-containing protein [Bacteroidales bacterium]|nr:T9SS type A sorting domain-containing protein [Bacteroidales bacterium]
MKTVLLFLVLVFVFKIGISQITITSADMPVVGDTLRISTTTVSPIDFEVTGEDYFWNFSELQYESQTIDTFVHINETPFTYNLVFVFPFVSTIAKAASPPEMPGLVPITITESFDFFKESTGEFTKTGFAAKINDIPTPRKYDNPELLYTFPLNNLSEADSSLSYWDLEVPGYGLYGQTIKRHNIVDGWGTVSTPFGSFDCLRLKSTVNVRDTFYVESYSIGYGVNRPELIEYKWLANGMAIPVLQIDNTNLVTNIRYLDSARVNLTTGLESFSINNEIGVFPNPGKDIINIQINMFEGEKIDCELIDLFGRQLIKKEIYKSDLRSNKFSINLSEINPSTGVYFLKVKYGIKNETVRVLID